jgi:hypothetical protein
MVCRRSGFDGGGDGDSALKGGVCVSGLGASDRLQVAKCWSCCSV